MERRREQERHERERRECEAAQSDPYEDKWAALHSNTVGVGQLNFNHLPWPSLENVKDITDKRVRVFMDHRKRFQGRWRVCHFYPLGIAALAPRQIRRAAQVLGTVKEGDRKETWEAAARIIVLVF